MLGIEHVSIFRDCSETTLAKLYGCLKPHKFKDGELIIRQGDPSREMFFISKGKVDIINNSGNVVASITEGEVFGEMGLVFSIPRTASVKASGRVECNSLSKEDFIIVRAEDPAIEKQVQKIAKTRFYRFQEALFRLASTTPGSDYTPDQLKMFSEVFYFWDRDNDNKLTKEETGEMMEAISGKCFSSGEIDSAKIVNRQKGKRPTICYLEQKMMDADKDGVISFTDFKTKIWNLRWFIDPNQAKEIAEKKETVAISPEEEPFWALHWIKNGCGESAQSFLSAAMAWCEHTDRIRQEGIYRLSGESKTVEQFRQKIIAEPNSIRSIVKTENLDVHCITGLVKAYFREMPEPLFPFDLYQECINAYKTPGKKERKKQIIFVVNHLPQANRRVLKMLTRHLNKVCSYFKENLMNPKNIAIIFGPSLLRAKTETADTLVGHADSVAGFIEKLITKPGIFISDDTMKGFSPILKIEPVLPPEQPELKLKKKKKEKQTKSAPIRNPNPSPLRSGRRYSQAIPFARKIDYLTPEEIESEPNDSQAKELIEFMKQQSNTPTVGAALMAYKEIIYNASLTREKCVSCNHLFIEKSVAYCPYCGTNQS